MGIKGLKISLIVSISFDTEAMPRLNPQQREQAIGRLHAGQPARVIANDFNCNIRSIERLRVRYNATNGTNDRPRCGRPQVTTPRQNRLMVHQHLRIRFTRTTETARQTVGTHQRPISVNTVRHRLVASNLRCYVLLGDQSLRPNTNKSVFNGHCSDKIGITSNGVKSSSLMKAVTASQPQIAEQDYGEGEENNMMTTA
jgi:hypothetical protein